MRETRQPAPWSQSKMVRESKEYMPQYYKDHAEEMKQKGRQYYRDHAEEKSRVRKERRIEFRKWKEFAGPCKKCGIGNWRVLQFHHINRKNKEFEIDVQAFYQKSLNKLIEELAKCEVLCANCHMIEEFENGVWKE